MVAGALAVVLLPDFPRSGQHKWLNEQEQRFFPVRFPTHVHQRRFTEWELYPRLSPARWALATLSLF